MSGGMYLAAAGAMVQQMRLEMLSNNVANINTVGYKAEKSIFRMETQEPVPPGQPQAGATQRLSPYAPPFTAATDFSQGAIFPTGNPLDVAINGEGFFSVQTPDGVQYTRAGSFRLNDEGVLVTKDGLPLLGDGGEIALPAGRVEIGEQGTVVVDGDEVGQLQVTVFEDKAVLQKAGHSRFSLRQGAQPGQAAENGNVTQGHLEAANINAVQSMTEMIETSRAFEAYQKVIRSADEATAKSISDVGRAV